MQARSRRSKRQEGALSSLNVAIEAMNLAKEVCGISPAKAPFGAVIVLLTMIRDSMINKLEYVELGLVCADICRALNRGMDGKKPDEFNQSACDAINQLTATVTGIQRRVTRQSTRGAFSRFLHAHNDKEVIANWKSELNTILQVFNAELAVNTHVTVSGIRHDMSKIRGKVCDRVPSTQTSIPGESPPPPPRACFGRDGLIEKVIGLAEHLTPIALIGPGGVGKTSIALTVLHNERIKRRFGENRWFIRCDQFPASCAHFLGRLSTVVGAGIKNPKDLTLLRPFLSSKEMLIVLDNAESILDPQGTSAQEIHGFVEELSQFQNICLCITSRISTIPPDCETLDIPTLSMEAARDTFHRIYKNGERSDAIDNILKQLDFHPLSITLLATVAQHNKWDTGRLVQEWEQHRTGILRTEHNKSLAATIELSFASPMFQELGPDARDLLGVVAFFPQGIDENNFDWLFPTISNGKRVFDKLCILSLIYRSNGFLTMLAPLRDHLCPKDPNSSLLLCATKERYFSRLSVYVYPGLPSFEKAGWITLEDVNVEHLLDVFTTIDAGSAKVWDACCDFMDHLLWRKNRPIVLGPRFEGLPDNHPCKPRCLYHFSRVFLSVGNTVEAKRVLLRTLKLWRERGDDFRVAQTLADLAEANRSLGDYAEGIQQTRESLEIYQRFNHIAEQAGNFCRLARLFHSDQQLDAAEEAISRAIDLSSDGGDPLKLCISHRVLGNILRSKGETEKAITHFETALGIASSLNRPNEQFWNHYSLAELFHDRGRLEEARVHVERTRSYAFDDVYNLGCAMRLQACFWYKQGQFEGAKAEVVGAIDVFEKLGATKDAEDCRKLLWRIEEETDGRVVP